MIDILIVGAGSAGLCAAKTFLEYDRVLDVVLVEAGASLGGVWSKERIYPTLRTNNLKAAIQFPDFAMDDSIDAADGQPVSGDAMHKYITAYAERYGIMGRIRLDTRVVEVSRLPDRAGWSVKTEAAHHKHDVIECNRLIIATGALAIPHNPEIKGAEKFGGPILHSADLGVKSSFLIETENVKTVAVLGGGKSAYDAAYLAASSGLKVEWIIRKSGRGPNWIFPTHAKMGPFKIWLERLISTRFVTFFTPCIWNDFSGYGWLRNFLHFNKLGRLLARGFWSALHADTTRNCGYHKHPALAVLRPEQGLYWYGTASGTLTYETDLWDLVCSGQIQVHRQDVSHLSSHAIHLDDGTSLAADALIVATGFSPKPAIKFSPPSIQSDLGIPSTDLTQAQQSFWAQLNERADLAIGRLFPQLLLGPSKLTRTSPPFNPGMPAEIDYSPWRLYRGIAPPGLVDQGDRSLVFIGMFSNITNLIRLEIQCLWALAYMEGRLASVEKDRADGRVFEETAMTQRYSQHRAPYGHGAFYPDLVLEQIMYWDLLLNDLGLRTARKSNAFKELFDVYMPGDYRGIVQEWMGKNRERQ